MENEGFLDDIYDTLHETNSDFAPESRPFNPKWILKNRLPSINFQVLPGGKQFSPKKMEHHFAPGI